MALDGLLPMLDISPSDPATTTNAPGPIPAAPAAYSITRSPTFAALLFLVQVQVLLLLHLLLMSLTCLHVAKASHEEMRGPLVLHLS